MRFFILFFLLCTIGRSELPTLHLEDGVSWKQVFDSGFRPKHLVGMESDKCLIDSQSFWVRFRDRDSKFLVEDGRMEFDFYEGDFLRMIWHQGAKPITLDEGKKKVDEFRRVFDGFITKEMKMPVVIDPRGWVDAGNSENNIHARIGEYLVWYGFDNSHGVDRPIIPHFYVVWNFPGMKRPPSKKLNDPVRPPAGYEWYSLDPKVDTPAPGVKIELAQAVGAKYQEVQKVSEKTAETKSAGLIRANRTIMWVWIVGVFVVLLGVVVWLVRKWKC